MFLLHSKCSAAHRSDMCLQGCLFFYPEVAHANKKSGPEPVQRHMENPLSFIRAAVSRPRRSSLDEYKGRYRMEWHVRDSGKSSSWRC